jgi:hypothetical protein
VDRERRRVDPADFFRLRIHMHELWLRCRNIEELIGLRRNFAEPAADQDKEIAVARAFDEFGICGQSQVTRIALVQRIEERQTAITRRDR